MSTKHTPGPWTDDKYLNVVSDSGMTICTTACCDTTPLAEQLGNARLISAAPDMLTAAHELLKVVRILGIREMDGRLLHAIKLAESAVVKAEGLVPQS